MIATVTVESLCCTSSGRSFPTERVYPKSQYGFKSEHSMIDMIFFQQLQKKCQDQRQILFIAFINFTKAGMALFKILNKISCPQRLLKIVQLFHASMKGVVQIGDSYSGAFSICISVKQGCVFAATLFGIFTIMLKHVFGDSTETDGIYLYTWTNRRLFSLSQLRVKSKVCEVLIIETCCLQMMQHWQHLWRATAASNGQEFSLIISLKKTNVMGQRIEQPPVINIFNLEVVYENSSATPFQKPSPQVNRCIGQVATTFTRLSSNVWEDRKLTMNTKITVYRAFIINMLL